MCIRDRVDAVASMLYLDYSKKDWIPNQYGGNENLEAIEFLKHTNAVVHAQFPGVMMIAEESTAWPNVSRPTHMGGLGFGFKWNMGWMHDVLSYMKEQPEHRRHHHHKLDFGLSYASVSYTHLITPNPSIAINGATLDAARPDFFAKQHPFPLLFCLVGRQLI